ncbi:hypothetical protein CRM22_003489 [Opisthorchis felineus]|uniref:Uncharacterized protein n=1 Tax=Opisthorchis felineus TaxID=147828 RepID=A0A4S2M0Z4_OPIFE|nr:hypothetical protein CRM22_003489 [Opisthorchis felineus]
MANNIDIAVRFKHLKSPAIPTCLRACGDEILARIKSGQLSTLPTCWYSMVLGAEGLREDSTEDVQELMNLMLMDKRFPTSFEEPPVRMPEYTILSTQRIFAVLLEFLHRCRDSLQTKLTYPTAGWVIFGPSYSRPFEVINEAHYVKEVRLLLDDLYDQIPIRRDILCYTMGLMSDITSDAVEQCRDKPSLAHLTRYQLAHQFGPVLFSIHCENCKTEVTEQSQTCSYCSLVSQLLDKPYTADVMDRLLRYLPTDFWRNTLAVAQPGGPTPQVDPKQIHADIQAMFCHMKPLPMPTKGKQLVASGPPSATASTTTATGLVPPPAPSVRSRPSLISSVQTNATQPLQTDTIKGPSNQMSPQISLTEPSLVRESPSTGRSLSVDPILATWEPHKPPKRGRKSKRYYVTHRGTLTYESSTAIPRASTSARKSKKARNARRMQPSTVRKKSIAKRSVTAH